MCPRLWPLGNITSAVTDGIARSASASVKKFSFSENIARSLPDGFLRIY